MYSVFRVARRGTLQDKEYWLSVTPSSHEYSQVAGVERPEICVLQSPELPLNPLA